MASPTQNNLKDYLKDEFSDLRVKVNVIEDKVSQILRRQDVIHANTQELKATVFGKDALLEKVTVIAAEHANHKAEHTPSVKIAREGLRTDKIALIIAILAVFITLLKTFVGSI